MTELRQTAAARAHALDDRCRKRQVSDNAGQEDAACHVIVNAQHIGAQTLIYGELRARGAARIPVIDLCHLILPFDIPTSQSPVGAIMDVHPLRCKGSPPLNLDQKMGSAPPNSKRRKNPYSERK